MRTEAMVTTVDNPYDPFTQYDEWYAHDFRNGHHTPSYLARVVFTSNELSETEQNLAINSAVDEIVKYNVNGLYKKVTRQVLEPGEAV